MCNHMSGFFLEKQGIIHLPLGIATCSLRRPMFTVFLCSCRRNLFLFPMERHGVVHRVIWCPPVP